MQNTELYGQLGRGEGAAAYANGVNNAESPRAFQSDAIIIGRREQRAPSTRYSMRHGPLCATGIPLKFVAARRIGSRSNENAYTHCIRNSLRGIPAALPIGDLIRNKSKLKIPKVSVVSYFAAPSNNLNEIHERQKSFRSPSD